MSELNIKIRKMQDNGSTFRATPESLYMGGVGSAKVDTLCFDVPEEWKGCAITLHVQRLSGTLPDPQLLDEKNRAVVDQRWTKEKQGLWMLMAVGADGYTAMTKPGRYTCYETIDRDSTTETITPSVYEQFVALVKKETAEANRAAKNAAASAEIAKNFESTITATGEQVQREITATADQTKQAIDEKAKAALVSIPEDYTELSESVGQLKEDIDNLNQGGLNLKEDFIGRQVDNWLSEHPEATTTVQDGSINEDKFTNALRKKKANYYISVEKMKEDVSLIVDTVCVTLGYYEPNDGGGATYRVREKITTDVDDGGSIHILANDNFVAEMIVENRTVNVKQFGARCETPCSDSIQNCINFANYHGFGCVKIPAGSFVLDKTIYVPSNFVLSGSGFDTRLSLTLEFGTVYSRMITNSDKDNGNTNITIRDMFVDITDGMYVKSKGDIHPRGLLSFMKVNGLIIDNVKINRVHTNHINDTQPIWTYGCNNVKITNCDIYHRDPNNTGGGSGAWLMCGVRTSDAEYLENYYIKGNNFDCGGDEPLALFVRKGRMKNIVIEDNVFYARDSHSIALYCEQTSADFAKENGFYCLEEVRIHRNKFVAGTILIFNSIKDLKITNNTFDRHDKDGESRNTGNTYISYKYGETTYDMDDIVIDGNYFDGSNITDCIAISAQKFGIAQITNNVFKNCGSYCLLLGGSENSLFVIEGNTFVSSHYGVYSGRKKVYFKNNKFLNCDIGINLNTILVNLIIENNNFEECTDSITIGISYADKSPDYFLGNTFYLCQNLIRVLDGCEKITGKILFKDNIASVSSGAPILVKFDGTDQKNRLKYVSNFYYDINNYNYFDLTS